MAPFSEDFHPYVLYAEEETAAVTRKGNWLVRMTNFTRSSLKLLNISMSCATGMRNKQTIRFVHL
jgi:hypothetical protein